MPRALPPLLYADLLHGVETQYRLLRLHELRIRRAVQKG
jgi:hypothetical protein